MLEMVGGKKTYAVIRAVYENSHSPEDFERELDFVLAREVGLVVIEPEDLGEITWRWIRTGNWLHKTSVLSGLGAIVLAGSAFRILLYGSKTSIISSPAVVTLGNTTIDKLFIYVTSPRLWQLTSCFTLGALSATSAALYALLWQWDPCAKYQVAQSVSSLPPGIAARFRYGDSIEIKSRSSTDSSTEEDSPKQKTMFDSSLSTLLQSNTDPNRPPLTPVVLIRRDDSTRKVVHNSIAVAASCVTFLAFMRLSKS